MNNEKKNKDTNKPVLPNQAMLFLRGFIGFYLIHQAIELFRDESQVVPRMGIMIFAGIFIIAGICIVIWVIRSWLKGEYVGGKADVSEDEEYVEYEEDFEEESPVEKITSEDE